MPTRFPVSVRISDGRTDRHVTATVSNLTWKKTAPGGFHSASMTLDIDPATFNDLGPADRIWIYGPTGKTLWEGFLENPGDLAGTAGVGFDLTAIGTVALASDEARALIYADRDLGQWEPYAKNIAAASASTSPDPTVTATTAPDGVLTSFNQGYPIGPGAFAQIGYYKLAAAGMEVGSLYVKAKSGKADAGYKNTIGYGGPGVTTGYFDLNTALTTSLVPGWVRVGTTLPDGVNAVSLRIVRTGAATNVADDDTWTWFSEVVAIGRRLDRYGNPLSGIGGPGTMQSLTHVRADWVVEDLIGRLLRLCDPNAVTIDEASYLIDQLAYSDAATAADVFDDLTLYEPDFLWEMLHSTPAGFVFNYRAWPTTVRYEVSTRDGYEAPGGESDLCNRVAVNWTDPAGNERTTVVTAGSAQYPRLSALEAAGRVRDAEPITLPEGRGSEANAQRVGQQLLAEKADPPKSATVRVRGPVTDLLTGGCAMPYEIDPGYLVRIRETGDVLRITEVDVLDTEGQAVLTLGEPQLTTEQRIERLHKVKR